MKKISILILMVFGYFSNAAAIEGVNFGVSLTAGAFEVDGAKEEFKGAHAGVGSPGDVSKSNATEGDEAEGLFAIGSVFVEYEINDQLAFGIDYVPHSMESETAEKTKADITTSTTSADRTNSVQVDFEDLTTIYATLSTPEMNGVYVKAGYMQVDVITNENLGTGGSYGNTELDGTMFGMGYHVANDNGAFFRFEGNYLQFDSQTLTNSNTSETSIKLKHLDGVSGKISVGKSF